MQTGPKKRKAEQSIESLEHLLGHVNNIDNIALGPMQEMLSFLQPTDLHGYLLTNKACSAQRLPAIQIAKQHLTAELKTEYPYLTYLQPHLFDNASITVDQLRLARTQEHDKWQARKTVLQSQLSDPTRRYQHARLQQYYENIDLARQGRTAEINALASADLKCALLGLAGSFGYYDALLDNLEFPDPIDRLGRRRNAALREASRRGHAVVVKNLLALYPDKYSAIAVDRSMAESGRNGHAEVSMLLLNALGNRIGRHTMRNACALAAKGGHIEIVKNLLTSKPALFTRDYIMSVLRDSITLNKPAVVEAALRFGPQISAEEKSSLVSFAVPLRHYDCLRELLKPIDSGLAAAKSRPR